MALLSVEKLDFEASGRQILDGHDLVGLIDMQNRVAGSP
jgi:hypothetical protein